MLGLTIGVLVAMLLAVVLAFRYVIAGTLWAIRSVARYLNEREARHVRK